MKSPYQYMARRVPTVQYKAGISADSDSSCSIVEHEDNRVYFYSDVDSDQGLKLIRALREVDVKLRSEQLGRGIAGHSTPIWLHIHSYGGELFAGLSLADQLTMIQSPIYSVVEGICASAATLISMACTKRFIQPSSFMLVHQLSAFAWGTHEQFKDEMNIQNKLMERLIAFYIKRSGVDEEHIRTMLQRDYWMDASAAVEMGFADEILG